MRQFRCEREFDLAINEAIRLHLEEKEEKEEKEEDIQMDIEK